jgi:hypothetical protein
MENTETSQFMDRFFDALGISMIIFFLIFTYKVLVTRSPIDLNSALYTLSALISSAAAIFAIVVSLSLIAMQLAAQSYSVRIIDIFLKEPYFYRLFCIYSAVILMGLSISIVLDDKSFSNIYIFIPLTILLFMAVLMFFSLKFYIQNVLNLLKPITIINLLSEKITKESILNINSADENDPIQPITEIIINSRNRNDEGTVRDGLNILGIRIADILNALDPNDFKNDQEYQAAAVIFSHIYLIGDLALLNNDQYASVNVIRVLKLIGERSAERAFGAIAFNAENTIYNLSEMAAKKRFGNMIKISTDAILQIGVKASEHNPKLDYISQFSAAYIGRICIRAAKHRLDYEANDIAKLLGGLGTTFVTKNLNNPANTAVGALGQIAYGHFMRMVNQKGKTLDNEENEKFAVINAVTQIRDIGVGAARKKLSDTAWQASDSLTILIKKMADTKYYETLPVVAESLCKIGMECAENEMDYAAFSSINGLMEIAKITNEDRQLIINSKNGQFYNRSSIMVLVAKYLKDIGELSAKRSLKQASAQAAYAFGYFCELGDVAETIRSQLKPILDSSSDERTCIHIARSYYLLNLFDDSQTASKKAISINPNSESAYFQLCNALKVKETILRNAGDLQEAQEIHDEVERACARHEELKNKC